MIKIEESDDIEFQTEVIQIPQEEEKLKKRTYENVEVKDHDENILPLRKNPAMKRKRPER